MVTPEGINDELRPWMTMSMPRGAKDFTVDTVPVGTPVGRCWMRLFGVLPFDYDDLMIADRGGRGFDEQSTMLSMRSWRHDAPSIPQAMPKPLCAIASHSSYALPCACCDPLSPQVPRLFGHRQRRLQLHFADPDR